MTTAIENHPFISDEEKARRKKEVDFARGSVRLEGIILSPEQEALNERYINGELTSEQLTQEGLKLIFAKLNG